MTHPAPDARTPRPAAEYRWTDNKAFAFLQALAQHGKVAAAARSVGMTRQSAYRLKQRVARDGRRLGAGARRSGGRGVEPARAKRRLARCKATLAERQGDGFRRQAARSCLAR